MILTYVISKLKFEKSISTLEERISSLGYEKEEKEKDIQNLELRTEEFRVTVQNLQMDLVKKDAERLMILD